MAKKTTTKKKTGGKSAAASKKTNAAPAPLEAGVADTISVSDSAYTVLARRYRPQQFDDVVGQEAIARALAGAIRAGRVAHAYLFSGARGVGKTSTARILAKALNCEKGPTPTPCDQCDACLRIATGDDIDVLEIDGASNRGIDEIRNLRQNVSFRPSRSRFKVYIIDEVHMLTREAFNALLKTLEEPPEHVKFVFCTTEPHRLPDTIRSRCQRFDFGGISTESIAVRLKQIAQEEGVDAEPEALELLARRGAGSMRDAQSLLDQVLAFGDEKLTIADVHNLLGTASDERILELVEALAGRDPAAVLRCLEYVTGEGVQVGEVVDQLLDFYRDLMVLCFERERPNLVAVSPSQLDRAKELAAQIGLTTIQAAMEILAQTKSRLRGSTYGKTLVELALVRIATLEDLEDLSALVSQLRLSSDGSSTSPSALRPSSAPASASAKKKLAGPHVAFDGAAATGGQGVGLHEAQSQNESDPRPTRLDGPTAPPSSPVSTAVDVSSATALTPTTAPEVWQAALSRLDEILAEHARLAGKAELDPAGQLVVYFDARYNFSREYCERPECRARLLEALESVTGSAVQLRFDALEPAASDEAAPGQERVRGGYRERLAESMQDPLVAKAMALFEAELVHVDEGPRRSP